MIIQTQRFGALEFADNCLLDFPGGVIGFPREGKFVLIPHKSSTYLAWLQSATSPELAFPVVSAHAFGDEYSDVAVVEAAKLSSICGPAGQCAVMVVLCATAGQAATVNLLAPVVVNSQTRQGAQVILEGTPYSTHEPFVLVQGTERPVATDDPNLAVASGAV